MRFFKENSSMIHKLLILFLLNFLPDSTLMSLYDSLHSLGIKNDSEADNITAKGALDE